MDGHEEQCRHCWHWRSRGEQLDRIEQKLDRILNQEGTIMSNQDNINADVAAIEDVVADENSAITNIEAEIAALKTANPGLDLSGLDKAVADAKGTQAGIDALETPAPVGTDPGTPVDGGDAPVDGTPAA